MKPGPAFASGCLTAIAFMGLCAFAYHRLEQDHSRQIRTLELDVKDPADPAMRAQLDLVLAGGATVGRWWELFVFDASGERVQVARFHRIDPKDPSKFQLRWTPVRRLTVTYAEGSVSDFYDKIYFDTSTLQTIRIRLNGPR